MTTIAPLTCTMASASKATGISVRQLYRLIDRGRLESVKVDRMRRVKVDSLRALVADTPATETQQ